VLFAPMIVDLGTTDAATQKSQVTQEEISELFWLNVTLGAFLTLLFAAASPLLGSFFGEPSLTGMALVSSLVFILTALPIQHYALMRRAMEFRTIATIDLTSNAVSSAVSVALAFGGWGYWSLVAKPLVQLSLTALGAWLSCPWVPNRPRLALQARDLVRFGLGVTGFTVIDTSARSVDRLALGYFYGPVALGYFQNAFLIYSNLVSIATEQLHGIAVSGLSKLRDDAHKLKRSWSSALSTLSFFSAPAFAVLAVTGQDFIVILLGQKWAPAGPLLCIFAFRGIVATIERTMGWLHVVAGRSDRWVRWGAFSAAFQMVLLVAGLPFGPVGVVTAYTVAMFVLFLPALAYAGKPLGIGYRDVLASVGPQVCSAIVTVAVGLAVQYAFLLDLSRLERFAVSITVCVAVYLAIAIGIFRLTAPLKIALSVLRPSRVNLPLYAEREG
jgi:polysaccharide transporter, PST family